MKTNKLLSSLIVMFAGIVLFAPSNALAAAFGISPTSIANENLKPGSNFIYIINLSANELPEEMTVHTELEGDPEIMQWLTVVNKDSLVMANGRSNVPMSVNVHVSEDAKVGKYQGKLKLSMAPKKGPTNGISVLLGANVNIKLGVVDYDITDYWVQTISADSIIEGQAIDLRLSIKNLGNTILTNVMTNISLTDIKTGAKVASGSASELNTVVQPQTMADAELSVPVPNLQAGDYWLDIDAFKDGRSTYKNRLHFTVESSGVNNSLKTAVNVAGEGYVAPAAPKAQLKAAAPEVVEQLSRNAKVKTSVRVRAPYTDKLIVAVIGILVVLTIIVGKMYMNSKKRRR